MKPLQPSTLVILPICAKSLVIFIAGFLQSQIAQEEGRFNINQVVQGIHSKIVRRHPHVFGDLKLEGVDGVLANGKSLKKQSARTVAKRKRIIGWRASVLPALSQAQEYQDRAARVGFDWPTLDGVLDKIKEEIEEIKNAETDFELASEIGDLFFVLVNFARWKKVDAESALRSTSKKFKERFAYVEQGAKTTAQHIRMTLDEMEFSGRCQAIDQ